MKRTAFWTAMVAAFAAILVPNIGQALELVVEAGDVDRENTPVRVLVPLPENQAAFDRAALISVDEQRLVAQLTDPRLLAAPTGKPGGNLVTRELHFILPKLKAGQSKRYSVLVGGVPSTLPAFQWIDNANKYSTLMFDRRAVMVYMYPPYDDSTSQLREATYKVFHHLYDPATGKTLLTKGPGGRYTHHRGIFYGFNKTTYDGTKKVDIWHCTGNTHQSHEGFLGSEGGPVVGRHLVAIDWHGINKEVFAKEQRELAVYHIPGGTMVEFASRLKSTGPKIELRGDPQHAGFHFRASNEVAAETARQTYYLRPDGKGGMGETRNWPGRKDHVNLPWDAMSFVVGGKRYTCCYLDNPKNPKEARFSERDYGRFGSYFEYDLDADTPLVVNYRLWLQEGEMNGDAVAALSADFVNPPKVTVK